MGKELAFWKQNSISNNYSEIYDTLLSGQHVEFIDTIPSDDIRKRISSEFKDWVCNNKFQYENGKAAFDVFITDQIVRFDCYSLTYGELNKIIDIKLEYGCFLYDPDLNVRFDGK